MAKKKSKRWNRVHYFQRKKSGNKVGHPVYVYGSSGKYRKYLIFTHTPENDNADGKYERLKHNIDVDEDGKRDTWVKKKYEVSDKERLRDPDKKYRIHNDDKDTIKKYKK